MPFYKEIPFGEDKGRRTVEGLFRLRELLDAQVPERTLNETLLLATWNIRDFDKPVYGDRLDEAIQYIAEIIARFDLVAVQEVYRNLKGLDRLMDALGPWWKRIFTDATEGKEGNDERMAFLYDSRKVRFKGLAGELVLPPVKRADGTEGPATQLYRTPFIVGFQAGWCPFMLATVHIMWGGSEAEPAARVEEIRQIAQLLRKRTLDQSAWTQNLVLLGDFNIFADDDETFAQLTEAGFVVPEVLQSLPSNWGRKRHYDQIAFRCRPGHLDLTGRAGVLNYYEAVFRDEDQEEYASDMGERYTTTGGQPRTDDSKRTYYRSYWRTQQMSDHLVMWTELRIDYSEEYLRRKLDKAQSPG